ncbi:MAG: hypothetical protein ABSD96_21715 [Candidatus Korobacteraceae bacterium]|jgi:hypothetical protein
MQETLRSYDAKMAAQRRGSVALAVGWTLLAMAMIVGIYVSQDIREGTRFFVNYAGVLALLGLMSIGYGNRVRRLNG